MSVEALKAIRRMRLPPTQKLILFALADIANDYGEAWPLMTTLRDITGLSERAIQGGIKALEQANILVVTRTFGRSSRYHVPLKTPAADAPPQQMHPAADAPTPAGNAGDIPQHMRGYPAADAPISLIEAPREASPKPKNQLALTGGSSDALVNGKAARFAEFWEAYPHRLSGGRMIKPGKGDAEREFARAIRTTPPEQIIEAVKTFPFQRDTPQFIQGPAVWLNKKNYLADVAPAGSRSTGNDLAAARRDWGIDGGFDELDRLQAERQQREK